MESIVKRNTEKKPNRSWQATAILFLLLVLLPFKEASTAMKAPPLEKINVIIIGDRVVDIAYNLGVLPKAMSVRGSLWPMANKLKAVSHILGCPNCIVKNKDILPGACDKFGVTRIIIEKSDPYCIYKPEVKPENIVPIMAGKGVTIETVDFTNGLGQAVRRTAELLHRQDKADAVMQKYRQQLAAVQAKLPKEKSGRKVVIINGTYQPATGKSMLRVEAPGGYADRFLLEKLGCVNAGDSFKPADGKAAKGHYAVRKKKTGLVLDPLIASDPDVIVMTGDAFAVQKALADYGTSHPSLAQVKAIKNMALYALPAYVDSGVLEYPGILQKWALVLVR
jgi:ABC-type hemin transport system substrate-binding protein